MKKSVTIEIGNWHKISERCIIPNEPQAPKPIMSSKQTTTIVSKKVQLFFPNKGHVNKIIQAKKDEER